MEESVGQSFGGGLIQDLESFLSSQATDVSTIGFLINFCLAALSAYWLGRLYIRCGRSLSNRTAFAGNFLPIAVTTMLVISIVKSSLALSLGLVGALSIVRFRAAIKEPEELSYLFLAIALGLGFGAKQWRITLIAFAAISVLLLLRRRRHADAGPQHLFLSVSSEDPAKVGLERLVEIVTNHSAEASVTRFDETGDALEATFRVEFEDFNQLNAAKTALRELDESLSITFMDNEGTV
jgi:hypothetical protein